MNLFHRSKQKREVKRSAKDNMATWVGALAHEIKNPLNAMKINLQLLQEDIGASLELAPDDADEIRVLKKVKILASEVDRLEKILNDFLRLARLPEPDLQPGNISALLDELLDFIEPETRQSDIELIRDFDSDLPIIRFDSGQMKQALLNVILNANQSMSAGGQLTIKAYKTNEHISINIVDNGEGIPPGRIDRLFDLFYSTKKDGTGLGLPIARRIASMHGGAIQVKSQENEGTTVSILLPINND